jgi:hypothetical protein
MKLIVEKERRISRRRCWNPMDIRIMRLFILMTMRRPRKNRRSILHFIIRIQVRSAFNLILELGLSCLEQSKKISPKGNDAIPND